MNKILVVDDDDCIRELVADVLLANGYGVRTATNGRDAIRCIEAFPTPKMILLDLQMPLMNGEEFMAVTRKMDNCRVPIVIVTAEKSARTQALKDERIVGVLQKPFNIDLLMSMLPATAKQDAHAIT